MLREGFVVLKEKVAERSEKVVGLGEEVLVLREVLALVIYNTYKIQVLTEELLLRKKVLVLREEDLMLVLMQLTFLSLH